jgi:hypothetical protein
VMIPGEELCGAQVEGQSAADENCDGQIDDGCECPEEGMRQFCYGGPEGTLDVGVCDAGEQECEGGEWGPCLGETLPGVETCANIGQDNDCMDGDFVPGGNTCADEAEVGRCAIGVRQCEGGTLACVTNMEREETCDSTDDDCDGRTDEGFDLQMDNDNCGRCGNTCGAGEACCEGFCVESQTDEQNCGSCGNRCGMGQTCCDGGCFNLLDSPQHCGVCEISCGGGAPRCCTGKCRTQLCIL